MPESASLTIPIAAGRNFVRCARLYLVCLLIGLATNLARIKELLGMAHRNRVPLRSSHVLQSKLNLVLFDCFRKMLSVLTTMVWADFFHPSNWVVRSLCLLEHGISYAVGWLRIQIDLRCPLTSIQIHDLVN